jgi:hypothetical protein
MTKHPPVALTVVPNLFPYWQAAREIAYAQGWDEPLAEDLTQKMLMAIRDGKLLVRDEKTGRYRKGEIDRVLHLVHPQDVNNWLESSGKIMRWDRALTPTEQETPLQTVGTADTPQTLKQSATPQLWDLKPLVKADDLSRAIQGHLMDCDRTRPAPSAHQVLVQLRKSNPLDLNVSDNHVTFNRQNGNVVDVDLRALRERIRRAVMAV